ncbi:spore coat protein I [Clostridium oryzae]|uniref:Spore coat protein I n=2 Tax=Clostridium oryzae TaxID=1450648 RepID=A0A1V4ITN8_9CLOT|nr:spore coat protein I [Clostridium oryzae]
MREFELERQFNIKIESIKANKGVYFVKTDKGIRCLKKINYGIQKLLFVYGAKEHLINNGYANVDRYYLNINELPYALVNEDIYTMSRWIEGRECDFKNEDDVIIAAKNLALLHMASRGYEPPENSKLKTDLGRWPHLMNKRIKSFDRMKDMARKKNVKSEFDLEYIKQMEFYKGLGKRAIDILDTSSYIRLCGIAEEEKSFCHHDYTYHNILVDPNNVVNVIDFDYSKREIRVFDVSNFMIKVLKRNNWDINICNKILEAYNSIYALEGEEYRVIFAFLLFPQRFWRLSNRYYYNEVNWGQNIFSKKIGELVLEQQQYLNFIDEFKQVYDQKE